LKAAYPMLQIEIYDADKKIRTLLSEPTERAMPDGPDLVDYYDGVTFYMDRTF
jgi:hypothetical protein